MFVYEYDVKWWPAPGVKRTKMTPNFQFVCH